MTCKFTKSGIEPLSRGRPRLSAAALAAGLALAGGHAHGGGLSYSGDDLSVGEGVMTLSSGDGNGGTLWSVDINTSHPSDDVKFRNFMVDGFDYSGPGGWGNGFWRVGGNSGTFEELEKSADSVPLPHDQHGIDVRARDRFHDPSRRCRRDELERHAHGSEHLH